MNKRTHFIVCNDDVIGTVFQHPKMGRTIVFNSSPSLDAFLQVYDAEKQEMILEKDVLDFFWELLPE